MKPWRLEMLFYAVDIEEEAGLTQRLLHVHLDGSTLLLFTVT